MDVFYDFEVEIDSADLFYFKNQDMYCKLKSECFK